MSLVSRLDMNNISQVAGAIKELYAHNDISIINDVISKYMQHIMNLSNLHDFIQNIQSILITITNFNDSKLCIAIMNNIEDNKIQTQVHQFFSSKALEILLNDNSNTTSQQLSFINDLFETMTIKDCIQIFKMYCYSSTYEESLICNIFSNVIQKKYKEFFIECIKQSYIKLANELIIMFPEIKSNGYYIFTNLFNSELVFTNKVINFVCSYFIDFINNNFEFFVTQLTITLSKQINNSNVNKYIIKWIIQNIKLHKTEYTAYILLKASINNDNYIIFMELLEYFPHLTKKRILSILINNYSKSHTGWIIYNYLYQNIFYNDDLDYMFEFAQENKFRAVLKILHTHYPYKVKYINGSYILLDDNIILRSLGHTCLKNMTQVIIDKYVDCNICYTSKNFMIQLDCHSTHIYCEECLKRWMLTHNSCPLCRNNINMSNSILLFVSN
jgi:hypothetical protein